MTFDQIEAILGRNVVQQLYCDVLQLAQAREDAADPDLHSHAVRELMGAILALLIVRYDPTDELDEKIAKHRDRLAEFIRLMDEIASRDADAPFVWH